MAEPKPICERIRDWKERVTPFWRPYHDAMDEEDAFLDGERYENDENYDNRDRRLIQIRGRRARGFDPPRCGDLGCEAEKPPGPPDRLARRSAIRRHHARPDRVGAAQPVEGLRARALQGRQGREGAPRSGSCGWTGSRTWVRGES